MAIDINQILEASPVVPLVQADDPDVAIRTSRALAAGGGSWLTPASAIEAGDYDRITTLAREALQIAART